MSAAYEARAVPPPTIFERLTTLHLRWVLFNRVWAHEFANDQGTIGIWRSLGFKRVIVSDGYDSSWTIDL